MKNLELILALTLILLPSKLFAADITIEMLNRLDNESMVFSQKVSKVNIGDTIFWKSTDKGHNVEFIKGGVPAGWRNLNQKLVRMQNILLQYQEFMRTGALLTKAWV